MHVSKENMKEKANTSELAFEVLDFDEFVTKLKNNFTVEYLHDIIEHDWGQRVIRFYT